MTELAATLYFIGGFAMGVLLVSSVEFLFWRAVKKSTNAHVDAIIERHNNCLDERDREIKKLQEMISALEEQLRFSKDR